MRGFFIICLCRTQAQEGLKVEPLGDELSPIVPEGFIVVLDLLAELGVVPVVLPLPAHGASASASASRDSRGSATSTARGRAAGTTGSPPRQRQCLESWQRTRDHPIGITQR
jgi:hypothetical protein